MRIVVAGAGGYVGTALVPRLVGRGHEVVALGRRARALPSGPGITARVADVGDEVAAAGALAGAAAAYYLVDVPAGDGEADRGDPDAAAAFGRAAAAAGVRRIVYLGTLWSARVGGPDLAAALGSAEVPVVELRTAVILGAGSVGFELLRHVTERLPAIVCPSWMQTRVQPIALRDVLAYLEQALHVAPGRYEIGGAQVTTYRDLIDAYARVRGLRRRLLAPAPVVALGLSSSLVGRLAPVHRPATAALIRSLATEIVVRDRRHAEAAFEVEPVGVDRALELALDDEADDVATGLETLGSGVHGGVYVEAVELPIEGGLAAAIDADLSRSGRDGSWLVTRREPGTIVLRALRRLPGDVWLGSFVREPDASSPSWRLRAVGAIRPRGPGGVAGWALLRPVRRLVFTRLARRRIRAARRGGTPAPPSRF